MTPLDSLLLNNPIIPCFGNKFENFNFIIQNDPTSNLQYLIYILF